MRSQNIFVSFKVSLNIVLFLLSLILHKQKGVFYKEMGCFTIFFPKTYPFKYTNIRLKIKSKLFCALVSLSFVFIYLYYR